MAVIRDMIPPFELYQPTDVDAALSLLREHRDDAWVLAGGLDSFDWFKDRIKRPATVVDLGGVEALKGIRERDGGGLEIGAMTSLADVAENEAVRASYPLLAESAGLVATPQIRNQGTLGGNIAQDTRCWYYRSGWPCYRAGGNICYAATPRSMNREHCILGASRCVAVNPSDTAPALVALDAQMLVARRGGEHQQGYAAADFFVGPAIDITRMTVLEPGDLLTRIVLPAPRPGARWYFEKVRDRKAWDFSLASVASVLEMDGGPRARREDFRQRRGARPRALRGRRSDCARPSPRRRDRLGGRRGGRGRRPSVAPQRLQDRAHAKLGAQVGARCGVRAARWNSSGAR